MAKLQEAVAALVLESIADQLIGKTNANGKPYKTTGNMVARIDVPQEIAEKFGIGTANVTVCVNAWPERTAAKRDIVAKGQEQAIRTIKSQLARMEATAGFAVDKLDAVQAATYNSLKAFVDGK